MRRLSAEYLLAAAVIGTIVAALGVGVWASDRVADDRKELVSALELSDQMNALALRQSRIPNVLRTQAIADDPSLADAFYTERDGILADADRFVRDAPARFSADATDVRQRLEFTLAQSQRAVDTAATGDITGARNIGGGPAYQEARVAAESSMDTLRGKLAVETAERRSDLVTAERVSRWSLIGAGALALTAALGSMLLAQRNARLARREQAAHAEASASADRLTLVTDNVPALISYVDRDHRYQFNNRGYEEWFGHARGEIAGMHARDVLGEAAYAAVAPRFDTALAGDTIEFEAEVPYRDGGTRWIRAIYQPDVAPDGSVRGFYAFVRDIAIEKRLQRDRELLDDLTERMASAHDLQTVGESLMDVLVPRFADLASVNVLDDAGTPVWLSFRTAGHQFDSAQQWDVSDDSPTARVFKTGEPVFIAAVDDATMRASARTDDALAAYRAVELRSAILMPIRSHGRTIAVAGVSTAAVSGRTYDSRDLELMKEVARRAGLAVENAELHEQNQRTMEELTHANAAKDEFLGLVSHELRTPITTIVGNAQVLRLRADLLTEDDRRQALQDIENDGARLNRIVENLLVLARLDSGQKPELEPVLLRRCIGEAITAHRKAYATREIRMHEPPTLAPVLGESGYLHQVLMNLLSNAEKYSPRDEPIDIALDIAETDVTVRVADRGQGVDPDEADRLFTAFYRSPQTRHTKGVGIGLAVCQRLIEVQSGTIGVRPRDGGGSEFYFTMPLLEVEAEIIPETTPTGTASEATALT